MGIRVKQWGIGEGFLRSKKSQLPLGVELKDSFQCCRMSEDGEILRVERINDQKKEFDDEECFVSRDESDVCDGASDATCECCIQNQH